MPESADHQSFESAIGRLEHLVEQMESADMPLEQLLVNYEEGTRLVKICQEKLIEAEKKIEIIQKKSSGEIDLRPFDPAAPVAQTTLTRPAAPGKKDISLF